MPESPVPIASVIVPNYNHARFLRKRIDSVLQQTFQDFELILLDDCSTDDSRSILLSYAGDPRVRMEFNDANSGSTFKQWNKGVRLARGEYVWIAESDDYADEKLLERLVAVLDADPQVVFAFCRSWHVSADDQLDGFADFFLDWLDPTRWKADSDFCVEGRQECRNCFVRTNPVQNTSAVVFRKAAYELVGGADESLRMYGDWKLWAGMALTGRVAYLSEPLNYFRFHDTSVRRSMEGAPHMAERLQVTRWILARVTPDDGVLERLCEEQAIDWVPLVLSRHVPLRAKWTILRDVREIDPHPVKRAVRPALTTIRLKFSRHWRPRPATSTQPK